MNTVDLVRLRSARYARLAVVAALRTRPIRLLTLEDFIIFKVLSTPDRDLEDARAAVGRSGALLNLVERDGSPSLAAVRRRRRSACGSLPDRGI